MKRYLFLFVLLALLVVSPTGIAQEDECEAAIETALMDYLEIDDLDELFDYMDSLEEEEIDELLEEIDIESIEEACEEGDSEDAEDDVEDNDTDDDETPQNQLAENSDFLTIGSFPSGLPSGFSKYVNVFGIHVMATEAVEDEKVLHAATVLAEYLDNNADGEVDDPAVLEAMLGNGSALIMFGDEDDESEVEFDPPEDTMMQLLYGRETHPEGSEGEDFDATLEEVLHLVTTTGYAHAYPDVWGEEEGTEVAQLMDLAVEAGHFNPTVNEPDIPYADQISEYIYWSLTSYLGAQDYPGRAEFIEEEWTLATSDAIQEGDPAIIELLLEYNFPQTLPDGTY